MARGRASMLWTGRELVDRLARESPARLAVTVFAGVIAGVIAVFTALLSTPWATASGKYVLLVLMFIGRVGTMTMAAALALRNRRRVIRYPDERPIIG